MASAAGTFAEASKPAHRTDCRHVNSWGSVGRIAVVVTLLSAGAGCAARAPGSDAVVSLEARRDALARARVWKATPTASLDLRRGPQGRSAFAPNALVDCTYLERDISGSTPKFACRLRNGDEVRVKYGRDNGEVYAEVAASRLLWALGFPADAVYPVRVRCRGCPGGPPGQATVLFDPATIERRVPGRNMSDSDGEGWAWSELDRVAEQGALSTRAQRDALKLLAALLQHTDSKRVQQRLVCEDARVRSGRCRQPLLFIADLGKTFGKANLLNRDIPGSVDLGAWSSAPIWAEATGCRADLGGSLTGTLRHPVVSDEGRRFLARLLQQLSDRQVRDLFSVARFPMREGAVPDGKAPTVEHWVAAFQSKVTAIAARRCEPAGVGR
jgi:hypothetical protein